MLGKGALNSAVDIELAAISKTASEAVKKSGGTISILNDSDKENSEDEKKKNKTNKKS